MKLLDALKKGQSLKDPEFWKKVQMMLTLVMGFLPLFPQIDPSILAKLITGIGGIVVYLTAATSPKVGV